MSASLSAPFKNTSQLSKGGRTFTYVPASEVIERLNACLGYGGWSFECEVAHMDADFVCVKGRLSALGAVYEQFGGQKINKTKAGEPIDLGDDLKGAASDAEKKCAQMIGVGLYLALGRNPTPFSTSADQPSAEPAHAGGSGRAPESPPQGAPAAESSVSSERDQGELVSGPPAASPPKTHVAAAADEDGGGVREAGSTANQPDDPETLLDKDERRRLIARFNNLPLEQKAQAMQFKRSLKLANWFTASEEVIAQMAEKVAGLEQVAV